MGASSAPASNDGGSHLWLTRIHQHAGSAANPCPRLSRATSASVPDLAEPESFRRSYGFLHRNAYRPGARLANRLVRSPTTDHSARDGWRIDGADSHRSLIGRDAVMADRPVRVQLLGELAAGAWGSSSRVAIPTWDATWRSRCCSNRTGTSPSWCVGSWKRPRSAASSSTRGRAGLRAGHLRRPPPVLHDEAGQGPDPGRAARTPGHGDRRPAAVPGRSSSRSARRWPTLTPATSSIAT